MMLSLLYNFAIEHMKNASGVEILQKTTNYQYDNNGNELVQTIEYQRPFATGMQESVGLTGFGEGNTGTINKLVESVSNEFDGFNRLKKTDRIKAGTRIITEFIYNGDDLRTSKTVKKSTNNYTPEITIIYMTGSTSYWKLMQMITWLSVI